MLWNVINKEKYILYINRDIDLKIRIYEMKEKDKVCMNYKGFNLTIPMIMWEFGEDLQLASIEDVSVEGNKLFDKYFVINKNDRENFLNEIYFFLIDNDMNEVLNERYRVSWK